jgi:hypothetical protein
MRRRDFIALLGRRGRGLAACGARAVGDAGDRVSESRIPLGTSRASSSRTSGNRPVMPATPSNSDHDASGKSNAP